MNLFYGIIANFIQRIEYLKLDLGGNYDFSPILTFTVNFTFTVVLSYISYALGKKFKNIFYKNTMVDYDFLISTALGYIIIGSFIGLLGIFSLLSFKTLFFFISFIALFSIIPFKNFLADLRELKNGLKRTFSALKNNRFVSLSLILFIFVAFLNLINPEIREDQYHVDFPRFYLNEHTIMIPPKEDLHVSGSSMLAEMYYMPGIFFISKESARYIHFIFYILVIFALLAFSKLKNYRFAIYTPLLFASAPVVIHETSSGYSDFQWILCFLLSILVITRNKIDFRILIICGVLLGGMIATKLWSIVLFPAFILYIIYLLRKKSVKYIIKNVLQLTIPVLIICSMWFIRAYILTGDAFFPAFFTHQTLGNVKSTYNLEQYFAFNWPLLNPLGNLNVFSLLFYLGLASLLYKFKNNFKIIKSLNIFKITLIVFFMYIFINYPYGRYMLGAYILLIFVSALGIFNLIKHIERIKLILYFIVFGIGMFYTASSILILPYTFGIADKNKYLSRILVKDNSSFYDFDHRFNKYISQSDKVAMYNFHGYYYADFNFVDINFVFEENNKSINSLKETGVTMLLIRGGDMSWFCDKLEIRGCTTNTYSKVSEYLVHPFYYLYKIN